jgi:hypothetical protein
MSSKRWIVIGASAGTTVVLLGVSLVVGVIWYDSRPRPWRADALTATDGQIRVAVSRIFPIPCEVDTSAEPAKVCGDVESFTGFRLSYTVANNTDRDITLSPSTVVKTRANNGVLDDPPVPITLVTTFIPARQRVRVHLGIQYPIAEEIGAWQDALKRIGLSADVIGEFLLQDSTQRLEVRLPKPSPSPGTGITAFVENP